jgi:putative phage-type endonuclease
MTNLSQKRRGRLTGSNVGAALGLNPWKTPEDLIRQMVREYHGAPSEFTGNIATEYGTAHEPLAIMDYFGRTGILPEPCGFFVHYEHDWLGATPDGLIDASGLIEVKCPFGLRNKPEPEFKSAKDQPHYYAQMQVEMACAGRRWTDFYQWAKGGDSIERVEFDTDWWEENLPKMCAFYDWYLSELDNPVHLEDLVYEVNTLAAKSLLDEYDALSATIDDATARKKEVLEELVAIAKERNAILWGRKLTKVERKGNIQYAKIPELKGLDLEPYRGKPSEYWVVK